MKKKLKITIFFLIICLSFGWGLNATNEVLSNANKLIFKGIDQLHEGKYDESFKTFKKVQELIPNHPAGYFFTGGALEWIMIDYRNFTFEKEFMTTINKAIDLAEDMIDENKHDPWGHFYRGAAYGFRGIFQTDFGSFYSGFLDGLRGYRSLKRTIKLDPTIYDAYYGLGMYHYWKSVYSKHFRWLGFSNEKELGIKEVKLSIEKGNYVPVEASSSMIRVYHNEEQYQTALDHGLKLTKKYPNYFYCYWYIADCYRKLGKRDNALETYFWLEKYFEKAKLTSPNALMEVRYHIGDTYYEKKEYKKAIEYLERVAQTKSDSDEKFLILKTYNKMAEKLLKKIRKELKKNRDS